MSDKHNQVNRYDLVSGYMQKWPEGEFVYYSDYVEILAERDADKALIAEQAKRIAELEARTVKQNDCDWVEHNGKWRPDSLGLDELVYLKTRKQELKIPYPAGTAKGWMHSGGDMDILAYRLAEPTARTVTVKLPTAYDLSGDVDGNCSLNDASMNPDATGCYFRRLDVEQACAAAGITLVVGE